MAPMIAQTVVEYAALQSISSAFSNMVYQLESYIGAGNSKYLLIAAIVVLVFLLLPRRRTY
jgi:hypothetical protein